MPSLRTGMSQKSMALARLLTPAVFGRGCAYPQLARVFVTVRVTA
jgi:hypothetical protein